MKFTVMGLDEAIKKVHKYGAELRAEVDEEMASAAKMWERLAKESASNNGDTGFLMGKISSFGEKEMEWSVTSQAAYSAFVEWGTGQLVSVPAEYQEYASQFKGQSTGGGFDQFFLAILDWVNRKGIAGRYSVKTQRRLGNKGERMMENYDVAFLIALKILKVGIKPHPFFFIHKERVVSQFIKNINRVIETKLKERGRGV